MLRLATPHEPDAEVRFRSAYGTFFAPIHRYVVRLSGDVGQAEDLAQEVFVRLWRQLQSGQRPPNTRAWLFRVASNLVISRFRVRRRTIRLFFPGMADEAERARADTNIEQEAVRRQMVERALARLPEPMRQCLLLHHEGLTGREVAEVLGVKHSYVATLVFRAHERFRRECDALGGSDGLLR